MKRMDKSSRRKNSKIRRVGLLVLMVTLLAGSVGGTKAFSTASPPLLLMVPDFLAEEWEEPVTTFGREYGVDVILAAHPAEEILPLLKEAVETSEAPDLAMVWDGWIRDLDEKGYIEHLSIENAYFPVVYDNHIVAAQVPWGEGWAVVIPRVGEQKELAFELLQHPCIWKRPIYKLEEYKAFTGLLAARGYALIWDEHTESTMQLGGLPIEIVVIPSTVKDDSYFELVIARDERGKTYAQNRMRPVWSRYEPVTLGSATLKTIHDAFLTSDDAVLGIQGYSRPGYCTQAANCFSDKWIQCFNKPLECIFDWVEGWLSAQELARLGLTGAKSQTFQFNTAYAWGSRFRAWKIYNAMLTQDDYSFSFRRGHTSARINNQITYDSVKSFWDFMVNGFSLRGTLGSRIIPSGHLYWKNMGVADMLTSPRGTYVAESLINNFAAYNDSIYIHAPLLESWSGVLEDEEEEKKSDLDKIKQIGINWEMDYDPYTQVLTATFDTQGKAGYGIYDICEVSIVGGAGATARAKLDGTDVHMELKLEAYVEGQCGIHPCAHGQTGGGIGIYLDITYPNPCKVKVTTTIGIGWGGHGDALNIKRESCDVYEIAGPSGSYDVCNDQELQRELSTIDDFTSVYGKPVNAEAIERAVKDYKTAVEPVQPWEEVVGDIYFGHTVDPDVAVAIIAPYLLREGEEFAATIDMSWVENLAAGTYLISFDPYVLEVTNVSSGKIGYVEIPVFWEEISPGTVRVEQAVPRTQGVIGSGYLAKIHFRALSPEQTEVFLVDGTLRNPQGQEIPADWFRAVITVGY